MCLFSSRRRQTRCALVTGVQTCALPVSPDHCPCRAQNLRQALGDLAFVLRAGAIRRDHHGGDQGKSKYCFASGPKKASILVSHATSLPKDPDPMAEFLIVIELQLTNHATVRHSPIVASIPSTLSRTKRIAYNRGRYRTASRILDGPALSR